MCTPCVALDEQRTPCVALDEQRTPCVALDEQRTTLPNEFLEQYLGPGVEIAVLGFHLDDLRTMVRCGVDVKRWADKLNILHKLWTCLKTAGESRIPAFKDVLLFLLDEVGVEINNQFRNVDFNMFITSWEHGCGKFIRILVKYGLDLRSLRYNLFNHVPRTAHRNIFEVISVLVHSRDSLQYTYHDIDFVFSIGSAGDTFSIRYINLMIAGYELPLGVVIKSFAENTEYLDVEDSFSLDALIQS